MGIYSANFPQGPMRPGINIRKPVICVAQIGGGGRRRGSVVVGGSSGPTPLFLTTTTSVPQVISTGTSSVLLSGMLLTAPTTSTWLARFNANYSLIGPQIDITAAGAAAATALAVQLAALPSTGALGAVLGNGQVVTPGVYDIVTPAAIQGTLTLNGGGDPNALFVIRVAGALTSVAASQVVLANGAQAKNVFFVSQGATALGANTVFRGTALAVGGAASIGNASVVGGRLLSTVGAVNVDTSVVTNPGATTTAVVLGVLQPFALFTSNGAVANTGASVVTGNIGTNAGAISGFGGPTVVNGTTYTPGSLAAGPVSANFGIYVNGVLNAPSLVTVSNFTSIPAGTVSTSTTLALLTGDVVTAQSLVTLGTLTVTTRTLSLLQVI